MATLEVAQWLLGATAYVDEETPEAVVVSFVEVEAYLGDGDPGCHASRGMTPRTEVMFGPPWHFYLYFIYGMHWCANVVSEERGAAGAVLLRAAEVLVGGNVIAARGAKGDHPLSGPGRLAKGLALGRLDNGKAVGERIRLEPAAKPPEVMVTRRVGLRHGADLLLRFFDPASAAVSRPR